MAGVVMSYFTGDVLGLGTGMVAGFDLFNNKCQNYEDSTHIICLHNLR